MKRDREELGEVSVVNLGFFEHKIDLSPLVTRPKTKTVRIRIKTLGGGVIGPTVDQDLTFDDLGGLPDLDDLLGDPGAGPGGPDIPPVGAGSLDSNYGRGADISNADELRRKHEQDLQQLGGSEEDEIRDAIDDYEDLIRGIEKELNYELGERDMRDLVKEIINPPKEFLDVLGRNLSQEMKKIKEKLEHGEHLTESERNELRQFLEWLAEWLRYRAHGQIFEKLQSLESIWDRHLRSGVVNPWGIYPPKTWVGDVLTPYNPKAPRIPDVPQLNPGH